MKVAALAAVAVVILAPAAFARTTASTLVATDGPGFTITLKEGAKNVTTLKAGTYTFVIQDDSTIHNYELDGPNGKSVKTLKAGTYTFVIQDDSTIHNYELDGPSGKSWTFTSVGFTGTKTITLKLAKGQYKAFCSPHESIMFQHFTVV